MDSQVRAAFPGCIVTQVSEKQWQVNAQDHLLDVRHTRGAWQCKDHRDKSLYVVRSKVMHDLHRWEEKQYEARRRALSFPATPPEFPGWTLTPVQDDLWQLEREGLRVKLHFLPVDEGCDVDMWQVYGTLGGYGDPNENPHEALRLWVRDAVRDLEARIDNIKNESKKLPSLEHQLALVRGLATEP